MNLKAKLRKTNSIFLFVLFILTTFNAKAQNNPKNFPFKGGEKLVYVLYYNMSFVWIPAGEVTFTVEDKGDVFHIKADGRTYKSYEWFYKIRDHYEVIIDKKTMYPTWSLRDTDEGGYTLYDEIHYLPERNLIVSKRGKNKKEVDTRRFEHTQRKHDILSVMYWVRNIDFNEMKPGSYTPMEMFIDRDIMNIGFEFKGVETKKVKGLGTFNSLKIKPGVETGGLFEEGKEINLWATNDDRKIPFYIEAPLSVGSIKAIIKDVSMLQK